MINLKVNNYLSYMLVIYSLICIRARDLAANIGPINEKHFTNIIPNQPTILIISNFSKESVFRKFKASHASHSWEAVNNHMWLDKTAQAG